MTTQNEVNNVYDYCKQETGIKVHQGVKNFRMVSSCGSECKVIIDGFKLACETIGIDITGQCKQTMVKAIEVICFG